MKKIELANGIFQYSFLPRREGAIISDTIIAIIDGKKALLIDTGYEDEAKQVADEFEKNDIKVETIIISHFHSDHYFGLQEFSDVPFYGSANFEETLTSEGFDEEHVKEVTPNLITISALTQIEFGAHKLELIPMVGHSVCTLLVKINDEFLFVSDDILFTVDGRLMVPWLCGKGDRDALINKQRKAWETLCQYSNYTIIPAHGPAFDGSKLGGYLDSLTTYIDAVQNTNGKITYEEAVKGCCTPPLSQPFQGGSWHENNCKER